VSATQGIARHRRLKVVGQLAGGVPDPTHSGFAGRASGVDRHPKLPGRRATISAVVVAALEQISDGLVDAVTIVQLAGGGQL